MSKKLSLILLVALVAGLLAACGGAATEAPTEVPPAETAAATEAPTEAPTEVATEAPAETITVTIWHAYQTGSAEEATLTHLVENAKAQFPNYDIQVLQIPFDQIFNKYQVEVAAGGGPDMFVAPNDDLGTWARGALVENLDSYLAGKLDGVSETGVAGMKVDGVLYGVPESAKAVALYYNKSMVETPPTTTDELLAAVKDGKKMTFFIGAYHMFGWVGAFGGQLMDDTGKCIADQGTGWVDALNYLLSLKEAGATFTGDYGQAEGPFRNGETAFFANGPWALADYKKDLGDNLGVVVLPDGPAGHAAPFNGIDGYYINPNSTHKQEAVDLALFLTSGESAQIYTDEAGHVPIRDTVDTSKDPLVGVFAQASAQGFPRPQSTFFANYWTPFGDMFTKVMEGTMSPADAVKEACDAMNTANGF